MSLYEFSSNSTADSPRCDTAVTNAIFHWPRSGRLLEKGISLIWRPLHTKWSLGIQSGKFGRQLNRATPLHTKLCWGEQLPRVGGNKVFRGGTHDSPQEIIEDLFPPNSWGEMISPRHGGERLRVNIPPLELAGEKSTRFSCSPPSRGGTNPCAGIPPLELEGEKSTRFWCSPPF